MKSRVDEGKLELHGAFFGVAEGRLLVRGAKSGSFEPVEGSIRENLC
ncbi:hypothetical protein CES86_4107 [Brucella lupini]|uniref:Carbonic anhydrase n=1 Tax=Brucella lupini TaxID=255457 RepID=A0A256GG02_9HYPH|nr:hypothetical protein CES86_4107 [Brucella lupini]